MDGEIIEAEPSARWKWAIVLLPALLLLSAAGAVWFHWWSGIEEEVDYRLALQASDLSSKEIDEHVTKLTTYIGERGWDSEEGRRGLRRTISYLDGSLSPQNYGFRVHRESDRSLEGELWPILWIDLFPEEIEEAEGRVMVWVRYDGDAEDLALVLAVINSLREEKLPRGVRFAFVARNHPKEATPQGSSAALENQAEGHLWIDSLGSAEVKVLPRGDESELDYTGAALPSGKFDLILAGSGARMGPAGLLNRAQWLRGFVLKAARRP